MAGRGVAALIVGSFQGRERLENYLIDDFLDSIVILPAASEPVVLAFATGRIMSDNSTIGMAKSLREPNYISLTESRPK
jgi:hypothetical protein